MSKVFMVVFLIFGTIVGSGFATGKEIVVFFSRFGEWSYFFIVCAGILLYFIIQFFLTKASRSLEKIENSKLLNLFVIFNSMVFCASMFAGIQSLFYDFNKVVFSILIAFVLLVCLVILLKGVKGIEKTNLVLMPIAAIIFLLVLLVCLSKNSSISASVSPWAGILYTPLYVAMNTSLSGIVISKAGEGMTKKQTRLASLFSVLIVVLFLMLGNFVLQHNQEMFLSDMPFLSLVKENSFVYVLAFIVVLVSCFTTLISMCFTLKNSLYKLIKNQTLSNMVAVFIPFFISSLGFSPIVSFLYPLCSVLSLFVLIFFFIFA